MNTKGIIFDFGFTLFYFEDPSVERYLETFNQGLIKAINFLKGLKVLKDDIVAKKFFKLFNKTRRGLYQEIIKTKDEYPSAMIFKEILDLMVGDGIIDYFGTTTENFYTELANLYHSFEAEVWLPFENTRKTLEKLRQFEDLKLAVLSNHPHHDCIIEILNNYKLTEFFDTIVTSAGFGKRKPHVDIFNYTIKEMGLEEKYKKDCIMCGDEYSDIIGGHRAGLRTIHLNRVYKFPFEKEIILPDLIKVNDISEILKYIK